MTRQPDVELVLRAYLADDGDVAPDRVLLAVAERIAVQPRRSGWRLHGRHFMNSYLKVAAAVAAVLVVAVVAWQSLTGNQGSSGATSSPLPSATAPAASTQPTATPAATGPVALPDGRLSGGTYRMDPFIPTLATISVVADIPADWNGHPEVGALTKPDENTGILIAGMIVDSLFSDPCHWDLDGSESPDQAGDVAVGPTVDDLVAALKANTSYTSSAATPITIDGYEGQELELKLPGEDVISTCDNRQGQSVGDYFVSPQNFYALSSDSRWHLYILDVEGTRLVTLISIAPTASDADIAAARAIVESFEITP
jgi:hypothetical protein